MSKYRRMTQEEMEAILEDYQKGIPLKSLEEKYHRTQQSIRRCVPRDQRRHKYLTEEEKQALVADRKNGATYAELQIKYGISEAIVAKCLPKECKTLKTHANTRREDAVIAYLENDDTCNNISNAYNTSSPHVLKLAHDTFPDRFKKFDPEFRVQVVYDTAYAPVTEIARLYGISPVTIYKWRRHSKDGTLTDLGVVHKKKPAGIR